MVELRVGPRSCIVALLASRGEARVHVAGICCPAEISHVTTGAIHGGQVVVVIDMALGALQAGVSTGQRKAGDVVIKSDGSPICRVVAGGAIL